LLDETLPPERFADIYFPALKKLPGRGTPTKQSVTGTKRIKDWIRTSTALSSIMNWFVFIPF